MGRMTRGLVFLAAMLAILAGPAPAQDGLILQPATVKIDQVFVDLPAAKVFFWATTSDGKLFNRVDPSKLRLMLGQKELALDPGTAIPKFKELNPGVAYTILLDVSLSVKGKGLEYEKAAAAAFISKLSAADQVCLISFGNRVEVLSPFTNNRELLTKKLESLVAESMNTLLFKALDAAFKQNNTSAADVPQRRAIIVLSDGKDEGSGITIEELKDGMAFPVYTIGYNGKREEYIPELTRIADISGGLYVHLVDIENASAAYGRIREFINSQFVLDLKLCDLDPDLTYRVFELTMTERLIMNARKNVRLISSRTLEERRQACGVQPPPVPKIPLWMIMAGGGLVLLCLGGAIWLLWRRRKRKQDAERLHALGEVEEGRESPLVSANGLEELQKTSVPPAEGESLSSNAQGAAASTEMGPGADPESDLAREISGPEISIALLTGTNKGEQMRLKLRAGRIVIGRGGLSDLVLDDDQISSEHAILTKEKNVFAIQDNDSTNGVFVNGVRIRTIKRIECGDVIALGGTKFRFIGEG